MDDVENGTERVDGAESVTPPTVTPTLHLRPGREYSALNGHPWLFSGAFRELPAGAPAGVVAEVVNSRGEFVARGHLNAQNSLAFRALTLERDEAITQEFYEGRIREALRLRERLPANVNAYRLVNAEGDLLPGLIVDRFDRWLVTQFHTAGVERQRAMIIAALQAVVGPEGILTRDDIRVREREGLAADAKPGVAMGTVPAVIEIEEYATRYLVDPWGGQKTGFFLDQREKRAALAALAGSARTLLNLFAYSGAFALAALGRNAGLRTVNVDASAPALDLARRNYALNGVDAEGHGFVVADVDRYLQQAAQDGATYDMVVVDPPAYAKNLKMKERALRGYETLNMQAAQAVAPGGLLLTCSCSGAVGQEEFEGVVRLGVRRAHRTAQLITSFGPSLDHPSLLGFPEDRYLKALLLRLA